MSITSEVPLKGTCCVCGKAVSRLSGSIPKLPGLEIATCSKCGKQACAAHMESHKKSCSKLDLGDKGGWCKTPGMFP